MSLLNLSNLLSFSEVCVCAMLHVSISIQRRFNNICYRTLLLIAELVSLCKVISVKSCLNVCYEFRESTLTESGLKSQPTLDRHCENGQQQCVNNRNDDTTFEDSTPNVCRVFVSTWILEVHVICEPCVEQCECNDSAYDDDPECASYSCEALRLFLWGCFLLCSCHNLMKF